MGRELSDLVLNQYKKFLEMGPIQSNIGIGSDMDLIARLGMGDSESDSWSQSIHFDAMCAAHNMSCYGANNYMLFQPSVQQ